MQTSSIFWEVVLDTFFRKKNMAEIIKLKNTRVKQQFAWINKILDDLITRLENFKTLIEFKAKYFEGDKHKINGITGKTM